MGNNERISLTEITTQNVQQQNDQEQLMQNDTSQFQSHPSSVQHQQSNFRPPSQLPKQQQQQQQQQQSNNYQSSQSQMNKEQKQVRRAPPKFQMPKLPTRQ